MKAVVLKKIGPADQAFEIREVPMPEPKAGEVRVKVQAFGLNYADVMARLGHYEEAPKLPAILGYDIIGTIEKLGPEVRGLSLGQRVVAMTRFGGYAEYAITDARALYPVGEDMNLGVGTALTTQCITAYHAGIELGNMQEGDHVLIHAAAGGVGTALVQLARNRGCIVYGTASKQKHGLLEKLGVDYPIDYRSLDFEKEIKRIRGDAGLDLVFDSIGGKSVKKGFRLLSAGGRLIGYGAAKLTDSSRFNIPKLLGVVIGFGFYSPIGLLKPSKGLIGVNMLAIADNKPHIINRCLKAVVGLVEDGTLKPEVGEVFPVEKIAEAHELLGSRMSTGKIAVKW